jgi:bisphosphoglycerate-independent phosphoglycerate mutase (AlkP superfamily)
MLKRCHAEGVKQVRVHVLFDGRDVPRPARSTTWTPSRRC